MKELTLTLNPQHLAIIGAALKKLPWELADAVLREIDRQVTEALAKANPDTPQNQPDTPVE